MAAPASVVTESKKPYNLLALFAFTSVFVGVIPGIILGHIGLKEIKASGERGRGFALAAVIIGYVFIALVVLYFIALAGIIAAGISAELNGGMFSDWMQDGNAPAAQH